jgi:DNA-binding response OmpR family regulator
METLRKNPGTETTLKKVLVVEKDGRIRDNVARVLQDQGYMVLQAEDGNEGLKMVDQADIILLDLFIPGTSGGAFMKKVRGAGNYVPIVVMSATLDKEKAIQDCESYGIVDFVEKPFKGHSLCEKIGKAAKVSEDLKYVRKATEGVKGFIERQAKI